MTTAPTRRRDSPHSSVINGLLANTGNQGRDPGEKGASDDDHAFDENQWLSLPAFDNNFRLESALLSTAQHLTSPDLAPRVQLRQMRAVPPPEGEFFR